MGGSVGASAQMAAARRAVVPLSMASDGSNFALSAGCVANGMLFISGQLGVDEAGVVPSSPVDEARLSLQRFETVLGEAGCTFADVVELRTYHVGSLLEVNSWFLELKAPLFDAPYPAWTQLAVASLALPEARVEIAGVAVMPIVRENAGVTR